MINFNVLNFNLLLENFISPTIFKGKNEKLTYWVWLETSRSGFISNLKPTYLLIAVVPFKLAPVAGHA
jgi:hypothetical protein